MSGIDCVPGAIVTIFRPPVGAADRAASSGGWETGLGGWETGLGGGEIGAAPLAGQGPLDAWASCFPLNDGGGRGIGGSLRDWSDIVTAWREFRPECEQAPLFTNGGPEGSPPEKRESRDYCS